MDYFCEVHTWVSIIYKGNTKEFQKLKMILTPWTTLETHIDMLILLVSNAMPVIFGINDINGKYFQILKLFFLFVRSIFM